MKIEFGQELKTFDGETIKLNDKAMTLRVASVEVLLTLRENDNGNDKAENYSLAMKIHQSNGQLDLTTDEIVKVKKRIGDSDMPAMVVGQCWEMLEGD